ncbi:MAG: rhomboid family intramembrane serine protease [Calditrichaeota bacterium]|nr:rhomboid family intramembrane serine protease [Calditrichota bacterium]
MIPIRDTIPSRTFPYVTILLIVVNGVIFLFEVSLGDALHNFINVMGLVPDRYFGLAQAPASNIFERFFPFVTSVFLHGGWFHVLWNMWYLWIFGDNVEDHFGHFNFFLFYIFCGILAGAVHIYMNPASSVPTIGASGAIAGVMGAYFVLYPHSRILTIIPLFLIFPIIHIPASIFLAIWFFMQFISGTLSLGAHEAYSGVAWWAHVGGFVAGILAIVLIFPRKKYARES